MTAVLICLTDQDLWAQKTCIFCVLSLVKPTKLSWNLLKIWSWNFTSCFWEPCNCPSTSMWMCVPSVKRARPTCRWQRSAKLAPVKAWERKRRVCLRTARPRDRRPQTLAARLCYGSRRTGTYPSVSANHRTSATSTRVAWSVSWIFSLSPVCPLLYVLHRCSRLLHSRNEILWMQFCVFIHTYIQLNLQSAKIVKNESEALVCQA